MFFDSIMFNLINFDIQLQITKISVSSPIVINIPTTELLAGETKSSSV